MKRVLATFVSAVILIGATPATALANPDSKAIRNYTVFYVPGDVGATAITTGVSPLGPAEIIMKPVFSGRKINPTGIVLHWTGGSANMSVDDFISAIRSNKACGAEGCSVQFYVDGAGRVYQLTPTPDTYAQHAAGANGCCIGIEIGGRGESDLNGNAAQKQSVARLVAYLVQQYRVPLTTELGAQRGILSHHQISPGRKQDVGDRYHADIINMIKAAPAGGGGNTGENPGTLPPRVRAVDFNIKHGANARLAQQLAGQDGYTWGSGNEFRCLYELWMRESSFDNNAQNPKSTAYGIAQFLNGTWAGTGYQKTSDPTIQIKAGLVYIKKRYKTPCAAIVYHNAKGHY